MRSRRYVSWLLIALLLMLGQMPALVIGQEPPPEATTQTFTQEDLDQLLAPIALYPDSLLTQVLMASTYPVEVVEADRWVKANPSLQGDQLAQALDQQRWDPSVKSLVNFPQVLAMMSEQLEWTTKLGDAFIADQQRVMATVQGLRAKAQAAGNLKATQQENVTFDETGGNRTIIIESVQPDVVYVPVYEPDVYGGWWYPAPPAYFWYPPAFPRRYHGLWFGVAIHCGPPWGFAWGHFDWHARRCLIDVNRNVAFNRTIDRERFRASFERREDHFHVDRGVWVHDPVHRQGVWYRDERSAKQFGGVSDEEARRQREVFRGRPEPSRIEPPARPVPAPQPVRPNPQPARPEPKPEPRPQPQPKPPGEVKAPHEPVPVRPTPKPTPPVQSQFPTGPERIEGNRGGALNEMDSNRGQIHSESQRGETSRTPPVHQQSAPSPAPSAPPRSSGGMGQNQGHR